MKKNNRIIAALSAFCLVLPCVSCASKPNDSSSPEGTATVTTFSEDSQADETASESSPIEKNTETETCAETENATMPGGYSLSRNGYALEQVVVLSRHNIRAPLSTKGSMLDEVTPHEWFAWSSDAAELSLRGGASETIMGQHFQKWLEQEGLFEKNYQPSEDEVRFYANSKQRTIATSNYFITGLLPTADTLVEYHMDFDEMDPVFTPQLTFISDAYAADVRAQVDELFADQIKDLSDNYELLSEVIDLEDSEAYQNVTLTGFFTDDTELILELNKEPGMSGSLKTGCTISDALVLQYYEQSDPKQAAFGHDLSIEDWKKISEIKDLYGDVLFTAPLVAPNVAHPLLEEIISELHTDGRKFTFLCGHDSNISSVLAALEAEAYTLPESIESKTPIGCKLVMCKWKDSNGESCISFDMVYESAEQLRDLSLMDLNNPPMIYPMRFAGMEEIRAGLYKADDVYQRFEKAISAYDELIGEYCFDEAA